MTTQQPIEPWEQFLYPTALASLQLRNLADELERTRAPRHLADRLRDIASDLRRRS